MVQIFAINFSVAKGSFFHNILGKMQIVFNGIIGIVLHVPFSHKRLLINVLLKLNMNLMP